MRTPLLSLAILTTACSAGSVAQSDTGTAAADTATTQDAPSGDDVASEADAGADLDASGSDTNVGDTDGTVTEQDADGADIAGTDTGRGVSTFPPAPESLGGDRPAVYTLPDNYDAAKSWPVVLLLHGYSVNAFIQDAYLGLSSRATEDGVIVIAPDGTIDADGNRFWNATNACCNFYGSTVDDVAYLTGLIAEAKTFFNIDPNRVFALGHSNGGFMSYRLACDHPEIFAGIVVIAGAMWKDSAQCDGTTPVAVLQVHGTVDGTIPYNGTQNYPGAAGSAEFWADRNGCAATATPGEPLDLDVGLAGEETTTQEWTDCDAGSAAALWTIEAGKHAPGFGPTFAQEALKFLLTHPRPE